MTERGYGPDSERRDAVLKDIVSILTDEYPNHRFNDSSASLRKDDLNALLGILGGETVDSTDLYSPDGPTKSQLYARVADRVGFPYMPGRSHSRSRPLSKPELRQVRSALRETDRDDPQ